MPKTLANMLLYANEKLFTSDSFNEVAAIPYNKFCTPCELIKCNRILAGADVLSLPITMLHLIILVANL